MVKIGDRISGFNSECLLIYGDVTHVDGDEVAIQHRA